MMTRITTAYAEDTTATIEIASSFSASYRLFGLYGGIVDSTLNCSGKIKGVDIGSFRQISTQPASGKPIFFRNA